MDVLIADDDAGIRAVLVAALSTRGCRVREADSGVSALHALRAAVPDVLIVDLVMPGLDGFGLVRAMRQQQLAPGAGIVVVTAGADERDFVHAMKLGADAYLGKPFDLPGLYRTLATLMASSPEERAVRRRAGLEQSALLDSMESTFAAAGPRVRRRRRVARLS